MRWINPRVRPGEERKVITGMPGKTGIVYTLDRETGEFLWARETTMQNVISDINVESGAATVNPDKLFTARRPGEADLPEHVRRQELSGRHVQPADGAHVLPAAEHLHDDDVRQRKSRALDELYAIRNTRADHAGHRERRHDPGDLRRDRRDGVEDASSARARCR